MAASPDAEAGQDQIVTLKEKIEQRSAGRGRDQIGARSDPEAGQKTSNRLALSRAGGRLRDDDAPGDRPGQAQSDARGARAAAATAFTSSAAWSRSPSSAMSCSLRRAVSLAEVEGRSPLGARAAPGISFAKPLKPPRRAVAWPEARRFQAGQDVARCRGARRRLCRCGRRLAVARSGQSRPPSDQNRPYAIAARLGSDVTACLLSRPALVTGRGERVDSGDGFPACGVLLANPGQPLAAEAVYAALRRRTACTEAPSPPGPRLSRKEFEALLAYATPRGNDLEASRQSTRAGDQGGVLAALLHARRRRGSPG